MFRMGFDETAGSMMILHLKRATGATASKLLSDESGFEDEHPALSVLGE